MKPLRRTKSRRLSIGLLTMTLGLLWIAWRSGGALAQGEGVVSYQPFVGLRTATFHTASGDIAVNLPDDMSAGDLISGSTVVLPGGTSDAQRSANAEKLSGYKIAIEHNVVASGGKEFSWHVSSSLTQGNAVVTLQDAKGQDVASAPVLVQAVAPTIDKSAMPNGFILPTTAQAGRPVQVYGLFDGDMSTSNLKVGGMSASKLAESPRKLVAQVPVEAKAATSIEVTKKGMSCSGFLHVCSEGEPQMEAPAGRPQQPMEHR